MTSLAKKEDGVIIGSGISGLAQGLFLQQYGIDLPIVERSDNSDDGHHLIWLAPNGLELLAELDLLEDVKAVAVPQDEMSFTNSNLKMINQLRAKSLMKKTGETILAIRRADLYTIMKASFKNRGGVVRYGKKVERIEHRKDSLALFLSDGTVEEYQYMIAADGIGSNIRGQLFPESRIEYQGIRTWLGHSPSKNASKYIGRTLEAWGEGCRFVMTSLDGESIFWSALERPEEYASNGAPIPDDLSEKLQYLFSDFHEDVLDCLKSFENKNVKRCNFGVVKDMKEYARGRVCIIGDAAHGMPPNMGQGASLGLEDAFWVAKHIAKTPSNKVPSFAGFYSSRKAKVTQAMNMANSMNTLFQPKSALGSTIRNIAFGLVPRYINEQGAISFYKKPIEKGIRLPKSLESFVFKFIALVTKVVLYFCNYRFKVEPLRPEHSTEAATLMAKEFERREPLCKALNIPYSEIEPFFKEMVDFNASRGLSFVVTDKQGSLVACVSNEDHTDPFIPERHMPSNNLQLIHSLLEQHQMPRSVTENGNKTFNAGLVAIKGNIGRHQLLPFIMYETGRLLYDEGYRSGYAKITNPAVVRSLNRLERSLPKRFFKLQSKIWPEKIAINGEKPFAAYSNPIYLFSWNLRKLV